MPTATMTSKGQITIPKPIRDLFHLKSGDRLEFEIQPDGQVTLHPATSDLTALDGLLARSGSTPVSVEAMHRAVEEETGRPFRKAR